MFDHDENVKVISKRLGRIKFLGLFSFWFSVLVLSGIFFVALEKEETGLSLALFILALITLIKFILITKRRLNDFDFSGWWMLFSAIPGVGFLLLVFLSLKPGSTGLNAFGAPPKPPSIFDYGLILLSPLFIIFVLL